MWVRAVVAALAVWCVSDAVMAAGYAEVWNPPEASGHTAGHAKKKPGVKVGARHVASGSHGGRGASAAGTATGMARGGKLAAHGGVKKVAAHPGAHPSTHAGKIPAAGKPKTKPMLTAQTGKPHAQLVKTKPGQGKTVRANLVQTHPAHPHVSKVAAKPAVSNGAGPVLSANAGGGAVAANAATDPATARSGSLPPIIH